MLQSGMQLVTSIWLLFHMPERKNGTYHADIYMMVSRHDAPNACVSLASLYRFLPGITTWILDDGSLTPWDRYRFSRLAPTIHVISRSRQKGIISSMKSYRWLTHFARFGWSGMKFLFPLVHARHDRVIMLDSDIIFFRNPTALIEWTTSDAKTSLYSRDYKNFSILSHAEMETLLGQKPHISHVNSGILCLNTRILLANSPYRMIDGWIRDALAITSTRMIVDWGPDHPQLSYAFPLLEQTLHWLLLCRAVSQPLPKTYAVFPPHLYYKTSLKNSVAVHYSGATSINYAMDYYILGSFIEYVRMVIQGMRPSRPWYVSSARYCRIPGHCHDV